MKGSTTGFVAWLRQTRQSAWLLTGMCMLYHMGEATMGLVSPFQGNPAMAKVRR